MKIGVLTGGGDVPGLNPCIKALVYRAIDEGHEVVGFKRGWWGPLHYNPDDPETHAQCTIKLDKQNTRTIDRSGGTFLHTSRTNPSRVLPMDIPAHLQGKKYDPTGEKPIDMTKAVLKNMESIGVDVLVPDWR